MVYMLVGLCALVAMAIGFVLIAWSLETGEYSKSAIGAALIAFAALVLVFH